MEVNTFTEKVGELVGQNKLKEAIIVLKDFFQDSPKLNQVMLQSARLTDLMNAIRIGTVNFQDADVSKNQIRMAILSLCSEIEENVSNNPEIMEEVNQKSEGQYITNIQQSHHGSGDNVGGDKIVNG